MIKCSRLECKHLSDRTYSCKCKNVILSSWSVQTVHMGRKEFLECKSFEESDKYKEMKNKLKELGFFEELEKMSK